MSGKRQEAGGVVSLLLGKSREEVQNKVMKREKKETVEDRIKFPEGLINTICKAKERVCSDVLSI